MGNATVEEIVDTFNVFNSDDISTEMLLALISDSLDIDVSQVIDGLKEGGVLTPVGDDEE